VTIAGRIPAEAGYVISLAPRCRFRARFRSRGPGIVFTAVGVGLTKLVLQRSQRASSHERHLNRTSFCARFDSSPLQAFTS
jgi:hypothetical protein